MIETETDFSESNNLSIFELISENRGKDITKEINKFIKQGENINQSKDGISPLHLSIMLKDFKLTKFLLKNGADITIRNNSNQSSIELAKITRNTKIIDLVISKYNKKNQKDLFQEFLFEKSKNSEKRFALYAIKRRGQLNKIDEKSRLPLSYITKLSMLKFLLKCQSNIESKNSVIINIINSSNCTIEVLRMINFLFKKHFINKFTKNNFGRNSFLTAANKGQTNVVESLLKFEADVNVKTKMVELH